MIKIDGVSYKVIETLSYHGIGMPVKVLKYNDTERIAVKRNGKWVWHTPIILPLGHVTGQIHE